MRNIKRTALLFTLAVLAATASAAPAQAAFGLAHFDGGSFDALDSPVTQAGAHPDHTGVEFSFNTVPHAGEPPDLPVEDTRNITTTLPPGFLGDPTAVPTCPMADFINFVAGANDCLPETQIGVIDVQVGDLTSPAFHSPLFNLVPNFGSAAKFGFTTGEVPIVLEASLTSQPPYMPVVSTTNISQVAAFYGAEPIFWGVPTADSHDAERGGSSTAEELPFISLPTSCEGPIRTDLSITSWLGSKDSASFLSHGTGGPEDLLPMTGCNALEFEPTLEARPTTNVADSPSGLEVDLHIPQNEDPEGTATAHLRDTTITLPEGLVVNPAEANGLDVCSPSQVDTWRAKERHSAPTRRRSARSRWTPPSWTTHSRRPSTSPPPTRTPSARCSPSTSPSTTPRPAQWSSSPAR